MYHYLTTKSGQKIVDVEPYIRRGVYEFTGGVCNIKAFLELYDSIPAEGKEEFRKEFADIDEMRGWFFERFLPLELGRVVSDENLNKTHHAIRDRLTGIAKKYGLHYGSD